MIQLNEEAQPQDVGDDVWKWPIIQKIARKQDLLTKHKSTILFELGVAYAKAAPNDKKRIRTQPNLDRCLTWEETPQGHDFWLEMNDLVGD